MKSKNVFENVQNVKIKNKYVTMQKVTQHLKIASDVLKLISLFKVGY